MPKYRKSDGTIVSFTHPVPKITQKMLGLRPARPVITVKDIEDAGKRRKKAGGVIKMRGGGIAKKGTASLSGYKVL